MKVKLHHRKLHVDPVTREMTMALFRKTGDLSIRWKDGKAVLSNNRDAIETILELCPDAEFCERSIQERDKVLQAAQYEEIRVEDVDLSDYVFKTTPREAQNTALKLSKRREYFAFLMGQGSGKTKVVIDETANLWLKGEIDYVFVFAPKGVHAQWADQQYPEHCPCPHESYVYYAGDPKSIKEIQEFLDSPRDRLKVVCVNLETVSYVSGQKLLDKLTKYFPKSYAAIDEASRINNNSKRTEQFIERREGFKFRRILSGTPMTRSVENLYFPFQFLDDAILGHTSFYAYRAEFCQLETVTIGKDTPDEKKFQKVVGVRSVEKLQERISAHSFRIRTQDCVDLPPIQYIHRHIEITPEQKKHYDDLKKHFLLEAENGEIVTFRLAIVRIHHLMKILRGFLPRQVSPDCDTYVPLKTNRIQSIVDHVKELDGKATLWTWFVEERRQYVEAFEKHGITYTVYNSQTSRSALRDIASDSCQVFISDPASGGIGLNLQMCEQSLWTGPPRSLEHWLQANTRVWRQGQEKPVSVLVPLITGSTEEKSMKNIYDTEDLASLILDNRLGEREIQEVRDKVMKQFKSPTDLLRKLA